jgi:hypothetical protein
MFLLYPLYLGNSGRVSVQFGGSLALPSTLLWRSDCKVKTSIFVSVRIFLEWNVVCLRLNSSDLRETLGDR